MIVDGTIGRRWESKAGQSNRHNIGFAFSDFVEAIHLQSLYHLCLPSGWPEDFNETNPLRLSQADFLSQRIRPEKCRRC
jgi:hypothetical protein